MSRVVYHQVPQHKLPVQFTRRWGTSMGLWGVGAGVMVLYVLSVTPLVKRGFLSKLPVVGDYWADKTPASDKPF
ncbi:cytochrome b-c1 complex subunit 10 [Amylocystis lapponica]|nr:cytochrome b-c1 complex subunit 10 [Amylocystis lapponica]